MPDEHEHGSVGEVTIRITGYVARRLALDSLALDDLVAIGIRTSSERSSSIADDVWVDLPGMVMSMLNESLRRS